MYPQLAKRSWQATKVLLTAVSPLQKATPDPGIAHSICNIKAVEILANDDKRAASRFVSRYLHYLNAGVNWADFDWKNASHFFNPLTGKGVWKWPSALTECNLHFALAKQYAVEKNYQKSMFYLGAAVHLIQDMYVPHHARGEVFNGHKEYEDWVENYYESFLISKGGNYKQVINPICWLVGNARLSFGLYLAVKQDSDFLDYEYATSILIPLSQKTTAGFLAAFYEQFINP